MAALQEALDPQGYKVALVQRDQQAPQAFKVHLALPVVPEPQEKSDQVDLPEVPEQPVFREHLVRLAALEPLEYKVLLDQQEAQVGLEKSEPVAQQDQREQLACKEHPDQPEVQAPQEI